MAHYDINTYCPNCGDRVTISPGSTDRSPYCGNGRCLKEKVQSPPDLGEKQLLDIIIPSYKDEVNEPEHYKLSGLNLEALDVIKASLSVEEYIGYLRGNILKYHMRANKKGGNISLRKAHYYSKELEKTLDEVNSSIPE